MPGRFPRPGPAQDETLTGQLEGHQWNAHGTGDVSIGFGLRTLDLLRAVFWTILLSPELSHPKYLSKFDHDLTGLPNPGIVVKGNHPQIAARFRVVNSPIYPENWGIASFHCLLLAAWEWCWLILVGSVQPVLSHPRISTWWCPIWSTWWRQDSWSNLEASWVRDYPSTIPTYCVPSLDPSVL